MIASRPWTRASSRVGFRYSGPNSDWCKAAERTPGQSERSRTESHSEIEAGRLPVRNAPKSS
eukprot:4182637-Lingulodinium_polyedra.AAC.1